MIDIERQFGSIELGHEPPKKLSPPRNTYWNKLYEALNSSPKRWRKFKEICKKAAI
jgi:hypothetical protein